jgi:hypothetical protein
MTEKPKSPAWKFRILGFVAALVFGASLAFNHLYAGMKAQYGLSIYMLVNPETQRAHAAWAFIEAHKWIGFLYISTALAIPLFVTFRAELRSMAVLLPVIIFASVGIWYWHAMAYLGGKFIYFGN